MNRPLRILYAAGPGDVTGTYRHWKDGHDDPAQVSLAYSGQFYDLCRKLGARGLVISSARAAGRRSCRDGPFIFVNRPIPFENRGGALYHLGQIWAALGLIAEAMRFRADVAVIVCGSAHWFPLILLPWLGVQVIPSLHCVLWPRNRPLAGARKLIWKLNRYFFTHSVGGILSASHAISAQLDQITARRHRRVAEFLPTYRRGGFDEAPPPQPLRPFRILYAGRLERDKGVFDLLEMAGRLARQRPGEVEFDLCGSGSALEEIRGAAARAGLSDSFRCHGHCSQAVMRDHFAGCHAVIVPTTGDFIEGFNQVVAEGILAGRPVITSAVCPAMQYVGGAVVEVPPDDVGAYADAVLRLLDDPAYYASILRQCRDVQEQFYDPGRSWGTALRNALAPLHRRI